MRVKINFDSSIDCESLYQGDFDLIVNGFNGDLTIKYAKELNGETNNLKKFCKLSEKYDKTIITAFDTDNYGIIKHSAGIFDGGKLLGITDMKVAYHDNGYMPGFGGCLYDAKNTKIAIAIGDDVYSFGLFKSFAVCGAEITIAVCKQSKKEINSILVRAYSYLLGMPTILLFNGGAYLSDIDGNLTVAEKGSENVFEVKPYAEYILKTTKIRLNK